MSADIEHRTTVEGTTDAPGDRRHRRLWLRPALVTALILGIPLLRNLLVQGWNWDHRGFLLVGAAGAILFGTGVALELIIRKLGTITYMAGVGVALLAAFLILWGNLVQAADDVNRDAVLYFAVPMVGIIAAAIARLRPNGMMRALFVTAIAQAIVLAIVLIMRSPHSTAWTAPVVRGFVGNAVNALLFVGSALLFRKAGRGAANLDANSNVWCAASRGNSPPTPG